MSEENLEFEGVSYCLNYAKITAWLIVKSRSGMGYSVMSIPVAAHWEGFDLEETVELDEDDEVLSVVTTDDDYFVYLCCEELEMWEFIGYDMAVKCKKAFRVNWKEVAERRIKSKKNNFCQNKEGKK